MSDVTEEAPKGLSTDDSDIAMRMRSLDWSQTPLGAIETWSDSLKAVVQIVLTELDQAQLLKSATSDLPQERIPTDALSQSAQADLVRVRETAEQAWVAIECARAEMSDRKRAEAELRASEHRFRDLADNAPTMVWVTDPTGYCTYLNRSWYSFSGQTEADGLGFGRFDAVHPDDCESAKAIFLSANQRQESFQLEYRLRRKDGEYRTCIDAARPWFDADGQFQGYIGSVIDIDDRIQAEAALRQSEERYRTLFESIDDGFCVIEMLFDQDDQPVDYRFLETNPPFEQQSGLVQVVGKRMLELSPTHEQYWFDIYGKVATTGESSRFENHAKALNRWFDVYAYRVGQPEQRKVGVLFKDISGAKSLEADRSRAEDISQRAAKLDAFRVSLTDALRPLADPVEVQVTASRILGEYLGANRVAYFEVRGTDYFIERDYVNGADAIAGGYPIDSFGPTLLAEYRAGHTVSVSSVAGDPNLSSEQKSAYAAIQIGAYIGIPLIKQGKFVAGLAIHTIEPRTWTPDEVTLAEEVAERTWAAVDRAHAEAVVAADLQDTQILRELAARLVTEGDIQTLYQEIMAAAIALTRADAGTVQILDEATQDLVLLATQGFERTMIEHFNRVNVRSNTSCGIALTTGVRNFMDFDVLQSDDLDDSLRMHVEAGYLSAQSTPLITRLGKPIGMVSTHWHNHHRPSDRELRFLDLLARQAADLIEQRQIIAEREQLLAREQSARAEADRANCIKDEFLAVLSHELRSPLNPILGWSKLLQQGKLDATKTTTALNTIERNARLQVQLIDDLLDISRILRGKLSLTVMPVDLSTVIAEALETVRLAAEAKAIQIYTMVLPGAGIVMGDAGRLQQVMWNLLSNAVKFTPHRGQITVTLSSDDTHAQIQVADTGKGIRADFLPYVFEHFRQEDGATTRKFGGLGLGLAIVRQIAELHGGTVTVVSPGEGQGATFTVSIPLAPRSPISPAIELPTSPTGDLSGIRILVVDDEADSREFVAFALEEAGAIVTAVTSGIEALQALSRSIFNLIVSDIGMPEMDGYMLMQQVRKLPLEQGGQIPAIALTAYAGEVDQQQAIAAGFQQHIAKPIDPSHFAVVVAALVGHTQNS